MALIAADKKRGAPTAEEGGKERVHKRPTKFWVVLFFFYPFSKT